MKQTVKRYKIMTKEPEHNTNKQTGQILSTFLARVSRKRRYLNWLDKGRSYNFPLLINLFSLSLHKRSIFSKS